MLLNYNSSTKLFIITCKSVSEFRTYMHFQIKLSKKDIFCIYEQYITEKTCCTRKTGSTVFASLIVMKCFDLVKTLFCRAQQAVAGTQQTAYHYTTPAVPIVPYPVVYPSVGYAPTVPIAFGPVRPPIASVRWFIRCNRS